MAKYIIDDGQCQCRYNEDTRELKFPCPRLYRNNIMGLDITISDITISGVTPYTEPDREAIEDEVWEFTRAINYMGYDDFVSCFGGKTEELVYELSYSEVKAKYDAWKQEKEELHVGDEVEDDDGTIGIVFDIIGTDLLGVCWEEERVSHFFWPKSYCRKTGRHFSEAERLLEALKTK